MSFHYEASKEERAAAALLRANGWRVDEPTCPLCHGFGTVTEVVKTSRQGFGMNIVRCPNGCPVPAMYYSSAGGQSITADATQGMKRGVG